MGSNPTFPTKLCRSCGIIKSVSDFHKRGKGYQSVCKNCRKNLDHTYYKNNKPKIIQQKRIWNNQFNDWYRSLKDNKECVDCKQIWRYYQLQFDHIGSDKVSEIATLRSRRSKEKILLEIQKCELVCANCHAERTYQRSNLSIPT